jgi:putative protein-disulfide isomerase
MDGLQFIYFADPMCSWCYGFSPVVQTLRGRYGEVLPMRLVTGGLRPGTRTPMPEAARSELVHHWQEVATLTGQSFSDALVGDDGFIYDTDPAARALVLARRKSGDIALDFLARIHVAFYAEGRDVTESAVLGELAGEFGFEPDAFSAELADESVKEETWSDYALSQRAGVTGFPTLIVGPNADGTYTPVNRGYEDPKRVLDGVEALALARRSKPRDVELWSQPPFSKP